MTGIRVGHFDGEKVIEVDTAKAEFHGRRYADLTSFYKRKFENLLVINPPRCPSYCDLCLENEHVQVTYA